MKNNKRKELRNLFNLWADDNYGGTDWQLHDEKFAQDDGAGMFLVQSFEYDRIEVVYIFGETVNGNIMYSLDKSVKTRNKEMVELAKEVFDAVSHRTILK